PLKQQAEMARRHEQLIGQAEDLSRRLAAARLRALLHERERRRSGWDEGIERRRAARDRLDALDATVLRAAEAREVASRRLAAGEDAVRAAERARADAESAFRASVDGESRAREELASNATRAARLEALEAEIARVEGELERVLE